MYGSMVRSTTAPGMQGGRRTKRHSTKPRRSMKKSASVHHKKRRATHHKKRRSTKH